MSANSKSGGCSGGGSGGGSSSSSGGWFESIPFVGILKTSLFGALIFIVAVLIKSAAHPVEQRPLVFCYGLKSAWSFYRISIYGNLFEYDSPSAQLKAVHEVESFRQACANNQTLTAVLSALPKIN